MQVKNVVLLKISGIFLLAFGLVLAGVNRSLGQELKLVVETGHSDIVSAIAFSPDGRLLASGSFDTTIRLWDVSSAKEIYALKNSERIVSLTFSPDGQKLLSRDKGKNIKLWDV